MRTLCLVLYIAFLGACAPTTRLDKFEDQLDTDSKLKFEFHRIVDDPNGLGLRFPGLVFGFEKAKRTLIGCPEPGDSIYEAYEEMNKEDRFDRESLTKAQDVAKYPIDKPHQVLYLNASELVRFGNYVKGGGAHSDIYTEEMGRVLLALIERFAP